MIHMIDNIPMILCVCVGGVVFVCIDSIKYHTIHTYDTCTYIRSRIFTNTPIIISAWQRDVGYNYWYDSRDGGFFYWFMHNSTYFGMRNVFLFRVFYVSNKLWLVRRD